VMKDTIDQKDDVVLASRALHVAARRGRKIGDVFERGTFLRRKRWTGEDR
jgi:hypothetical protein